MLNLEQQLVVVLCLYLFRAFYNRHIKSRAIKRRFKLKKYIYVLHLIFRILASTYNEAAYFSLPIQHWHWVTLLLLSLLPHQSPYSLYFHLILILCIINFGHSIIAIPLPSSLYRHRSWKEQKLGTREIHHYNTYNYHNCS